MPIIKNPVLPSYLISCNSKRKHQRLKSFDSISSCKSSNSRSAASSRTSTRCSNGTTVETKPTVSKFRGLYNGGFFPFIIDYSADLDPGTSKLKLAWKEPIQVLEVNLFFSQLLEGYQDCQPRIHRIVDAALEDLLRHGTLGQLYQMGRLLEKPFRRLFMSSNEASVRSGIQALQLMLRVIQKAVVLDPKSLQCLLTPINRYAVQSRNIFDMEALYKNKADLLDMVDKALSIMESYASDSKQHFKYMKAVNTAYKCYSSKLIPAKNAVVNLKKTKTKQNIIQRCVHLRRHHNPYGWKQLQRFSIIDDCRNLLTFMPWVVPKASNFYFKPNDIRVIDINLH